MNNIYKNILRASIAILVFFIASQAETQEIINNDSLRFGNGAEQSINATGNVQQPFYYNSTSMLWRKLTYSSYPLDYSVAIGGDGTSEWNTNGTMVNNPTLVGQVIDNSSFITTTGNNGYGTIISTGTINVGGSNLEIQSIYELGETDNFIKITTQITNNSGAAISNLRYWVGTRDDYVGGTDGPQKQRGNLVDGAFQINTAATERASALLIKTSTEGVLFYTDSEKGNNIIQSCCSWSNVTNQNPQTAAIDATGDGSYGFYVRMNDLANGESDEFNWYYAAGELGVLDDIIADVAHASGAVNNITCDAADYTAKVSVDATGYYIVVDEGSTAPTEAQIKAGVDYSGVSVIAQGTSAMTADVDHVFNITGLTVEMDYDLYFVAEDAVPQFTAIINSAFSTDDTTDPETPILADVTGECDATITETTPTTTDNCAGTITGTTSDPLSYTTQGTHVVAWTFDDGNGNSIVVNQNVIINDVTDPLTPTLEDVTGECEATAVAPTTTDACAGTITGTTTDPLTYTSQGTHVIAWTFDDGNGNSIVVNQNVIIDDVTDPLTPTLEDVTGECEATVVAPTTTDACAGTITGITTDPLTYTTQGTHVIAWTFDDGNGNSIVVNQNVVVDDVIVPVVLTRNPSVMLDVNGSASITTEDIDNGSSDNCDIALLQLDKTDFNITNLGTNTVNLTVNDVNGNTASGSAIVTIVDHPPVITESQEFSLSEDAGNGATIGTVAATDAVVGSTFGDWTIVSGNGDGIFEIGNSSGEISVKSNANLDFETTNSYTLTLTVRDGVSASDPETITIAIVNVNEKPTASAGQDQDVSANTLVQLDGTGSTDPEGTTLMYQWTAPSGIVLSDNTAAQPTFTAPDVASESTFVFRLVVSDGELSSEESEVAVTVQMATDIDSNVKSNSKIKVYPNPSSGNFTLQLGEVSVEGVVVTICDKQGREVHNQKYYEETIPMNIPLRPGLYILKVNSEGKLKTTKIVIK